MKGLENNFDKQPNEFCTWIKHNDLAEFMEVYKEGRAV